MGSATDVVEVQLRLFSMRHNIFPRFRCASNGHHETPRQIIFDCLDMPVAGQFFRRTWFHSGWTLDVPGSWFVGMWSHYCWNLRLVDVLGLWRGFCATLVNRSGNGDDPLVDDCLIRRRKSAGFTICLFGYVPDLHAWISAV